MASKRAKRATATACINGGSAEMEAAQPANSLAAQVPKATVPSHSTDRRARTSTYWPPSRTSAGIDAARTIEAIVDATAAVEQSGARPMAETAEAVHIAAIVHAQNILPALRYPKHDRQTTPMHPRAERTRGSRMLEYHGNGG